MSAFLFWLQMLTLTDSTAPPVSGTALLMEDGAALQTEDGTDIEEEG